MIHFDINHTLKCKNFDELNETPGNIFTVANNYQKVMSAKYLFQQHFHQHDQDLISLKDMY